MNNDMLIQDVNRICEALAARGFYVRALHNRLVPEPGAARGEWAICRRF